MRTRPFVSGRIISGALAAAALSLAGPAAATPGSDLIVADAQADRASAQPGEQLAVSARVTNVGSAAASASRLKYYFSVDAILDSADSYLNYDNVGALSAGASEAETANVRVPAGTPAGAYFVLLVADYDGAVAEIDERNNTVALPVAVGSGSSGADLRVESVALATAQALPDEVVPVSCTVANRGSEATVETRLKYYLSSDPVHDAADTYLNYDAVAPLAPGATSAETANLRVPAGTADGLYFILFVADQTELVVESDEQNNVHAEPLAVGSALPRADLVLGGVSTGAAVRAGETVDVSATVYNVGAAESATARLVYFLSTDPFYDASDKQLSYDQVDPLPVGAASPEDAALRISSATDAGNYFILFVLDADEAVDESDELNNLVALPLVVDNDDPDAIKPDLILTAATLDASVVAAGSSLTASATLENVGVAEAAASRLKYYLSVDAAWDAADTYLNYDNIGVLPVGGSSSESATFTLGSHLSDGSYHVLVVADANKDVAERYESNNVAALPFTIGTAPPGGPVDDPDAAAPDLMVVDIWVDSIEVKAGERASLGCVVENVGAYGAAESKVKYYLSRDPVFDGSDRYAGYDNVPALAPGDSSPESVTPMIDAETAHGRWYLLAVADAAGDLAETFESNNVASVPIEVVVDDPSLDAADLVASPPHSGSALDKATVGAGFELAIDVRVENTGSQPAAPSRVKYYLSRDTRHDASDALVAYRRLESLGVGAAEQIHADARIPFLAEPGPAYVLVVVDSERVVTERYESNNVLALAVTIGADEGPNPVYPYACPSTVFTDPSILAQSTVASFNALRLGWNNNKDMPALACIVSHFDLVGLVEVYQPQGVVDLELAVEALTGEGWSHHVSATAVGDANGVEYYGYLWRDAEVTMTGALGFYDDPGDLIKREPYGASFQMGAFDFTFVLFHLQYGHTLATRRFEAEQLIDVYDFFQLAGGGDMDVLIGGDFNLPGDDAAFTLVGLDGITFTTDPEQNTTIGTDGLASPFDNIFYPADFVTELVEAGAHDFTNGNWSVVRETISDHIPVWAAFDTSTDDD